MLKQRDRTTSIYLSLCLGSRQRVGVDLTVCCTAS